MLFGLEKKSVCVGCLQQNFVLEHFVAEQDMLPNQPLMLCTKCDQEPPPPLENKTMSGVAEQRTENMSSVIAV